MPVMGGLEVLENIRTKRPFIEDPILQNIPVVLMTATHMTGDLQRYLNRGANDIFAKPVRINRIRQLLLRWSRREVVPLPYGQLPGPGVKMRPVWGPMPLRGYRGPKSLL